ncbi:hypothetical protein [Mycolicibacterium chlorophenolicum]|uniref:Uncharacterized protein n=1 Tax=Mycolicibacterium chlorophenolicum TaxID=37916 RepID=A0A0J6WK67_9MYCO|nr:hypothetical protein [Mycolicibacterium chlorophenolicum]KMO82398.1 hypothetical protein MCHLDSM_01021 [Mycolicibacterium chlorophenolicum]
MDATAAKGAATQRLRTAHTRTRELAERVAAAIPAQLGVHAADAGAQVRTGISEGHGAPYVICWETGPFQWAYRVDLLAAIQQQFGVQVETVNHFTVAVTARDGDQRTAPWHNPRR